MDAGKTSTGKETMMDIDQIRKEIDATDQQIKELLIKRMACSHKVAQSKLESGNLAIYRADREASILETLGSQVDEDIRPEYLAVVKKVMEASRMYQYGLIYDWCDDAFAKVNGHELASDPGQAVKVRLTRENKPNAMSAILSMIGDHGFNMDRMTPVNAAPNSPTVTFDLVILGNAHDENMRKLLFQLSGETIDFRITENLA